MTDNNLNPASVGFNPENIHIIDKDASETFNIGMACGGGGARGFAHIGVFHAFEKSGYKPEILSGVSAGSIAAVMYGAGMTPGDIFTAFSEYGKFGDFTDWTLPKESLLKLDKFGTILDSWLPVNRLEDMKIPTYVCASDLDSGKSVAWSAGEIIPRVLASCSIPIIFAPVQINGRHYVDGGVLRNLPAWAIRHRCKKLIGSNVSPFEPKTDYKHSLLGIALRTFHMMSRANSIEDACICDWLIESDSMQNFKTFEVASMKKIMWHGYDCASKIIEQIVSESEKNS